MAGKYGSASVFFLVDGYNLISSKLQSLRYKIMSLTEPTHGLGDSWEEHTPVGLSRAEVAQEGAFFDTSAGNIHAAMSTQMPATPQDSVRIVSMGFAGSSNGQPFIGFEGTYSHDYEVTGQVGQLQRANVAYTVTGQADPGVILHALGAETESTDTEAASADHADELQRVVPITSNTASTAVKTITTTVAHNLATSETVVISGTSANSPDINGEHAVLSVPSNTSFTISTTATGTSGTGGTLVKGRTINGGAAYLNVTDISMTTSTGAQITVRDSSDDSTFADLAAFTSVAAIGGQRIEASGEVQRYLAQSIAFSSSGTNSATYFVGFSRI